jgi:hypothetical protein
MKPAAFVFLTLALAPMLGKAAENLLANGSFEVPAIDGRVAAAIGGNPVLATESGWARLVDKNDEEGGKLILGLTREIAHSGKQALFVDFQRLTASSEVAFLVTKPVPIKPSTNYKVSIWGRMDRDRPLALDERTPFMQIGMEFLLADQQTPAAEAQHALLVIPAAVIPGGKVQLLFVARRWNIAETIVKAPANAAFMRITWSWATPKNEGETDGVIYWDDAAIEETTEAPLSTPPPAPPAEPAKPAEKEPAPPEKP